ncbi:hypothetical protein L9F63_023261, partial [Diploptera punctata]
NKKDSSVKADDNELIFVVEQKLFFYCNNRWTSLLARTCKNTPRFGHELLSFTSLMAKPSEDDRGDGLTCRWLDFRHNTHRLVLFVLL